MEITLTTHSHERRRHDATASGTELTDDIMVPVDMTFPAAHSICMAENAQAENSRYRVGECEVPYPSTLAWAVSADQRQF